MALTLDALEQAFTMEEAATLLRISRRNLQEVIKRFPYFYPNGSRKLFTETDIANLRAALRNEAEQERQRNKECLSKSSRRAPGKAPTSPFGGRTSGSMWTEVQSRLAKRMQQNA